jgi:low affinity Fe/Cu permease
MKDGFRKIANSIANAVGTPWSFLIALAIVIVWAVSGPLFKFSDTWQLVINTGTTIVTFLMVFLIQNAQNRDAKAIHLKLDEVLRSMHEARDSLVDIEDAPDKEMERYDREFRFVHEKAEDGSTVVIQTDSRHSH